jgi:ABC-type dipeptide/oligopeptide/nickel transport system permease subunit
MKVLASIITILGTLAAIFGSTYGAYRMNRDAWGRGVQDARPETSLRKFWRYLLNAVAAVVVIVTATLLVGVGIKVVIQLFDL